jgi:hypothetical protein
MNTLKLSHDLRDIASKLDKMIETSAGERVAFTLLVFTEGRASYISSASREDSVREINYLLELWDAGMPDIPAHDYAS